MQIDDNVTANPPPFAGATDGTRYDFERGKTGRIIAVATFRNRGSWAHVRFPLAFGSHCRWMPVCWLEQAV